jgi:NnrS protein
LVSAPESAIAPWTELAAGLAVGLRLARWRGQTTLREPLLWILHLGYGWLALGFILLAINGLVPLLPSTTALHALTTGAIGTMTLAVMTRASLGHTGRPLVAGRGTNNIYVLVTLAALLRLLAPLGGPHYVLPLSAAVGVGLRLRALCIALCTPTRAASGQRWDWSADLSDSDRPWRCTGSNRRNVQRPGSLWKKWPFQRCHLIWIKASIGTADIMLPTH